MLVNNTASTSEYFKYRYLSFYITAVNILYSYIGVHCLLFGLQYSDDHCQTKARVSISTSFIVYGLMSIGATLFSIICSVVLKVWDKGWRLHKNVMVACIWIAAYWFIVMRIVIIRSSNDCINDARGLYNITILIYIIVVGGCYHVVTRIMIRIG